MQLVNASLTKVLADKNGQNQDDDDKYMLQCVNCNVAFAWSDSLWVHVRQNHSDFLPPADKGDIDKAYTSDEWDGL